VFLDAKSNLHSVGMTGRLVIRRPHEVRLQFDLAGRPGLDIGSNDQRSWLWCPRSEPPVRLLAKRKDLLRGAAGNWALPAGPEDLLWILGMVERAPDAAAEVIARADSLELVEKVTSPQRKPLRRITVFHRGAVAPGRSQIKEGRAIQLFTPPQAVAEPGEQP
jgi:hypothetical protein